MNEALTEIISSGPGTAYVIVASALVVSSTILAVVIGTGRERPQHNPAQWRAHARPSGQSR